MQKKWYYAVDGARSGPVSFEELRDLAQAGALKELDLVWQPEFGSEWRNAGQVRALFEAGQVPALPPPATGAQGRVPLLGVTGARPSCFAAASEAYARTASVLFRPFDLNRWFSMGFAAWLAYIGTQSGNFNPGGLDKGGGSGALKAQLDGLLEHLAGAACRPALLAGAAAVVAAGLLFALGLCWVRSRGDFMFLHRWYRPDAPIRDGWQAAKASGQALFAWRVAFFLVAGLLFGLVALFAYSHILRPYLAEGKVWSGALLTPAVACATAAVLLSVAVQVVAHLAKAFVVPVMYWHGVTAAQAWRAVFELCNQYPVAVLGYLLYGLLCSIAAAAAVLLFGLLTCCIGFIPMILPYFGAVMLLPAYLFFRGYAVCFLSQWRPDLIPAKA